MILVVFHFTCCLLFEHYLLTNTFLKNKLSSKVIEILLPEAVYTLEEGQFISVLSDYISEYLSHNSK